MYASRRTRYQRALYLRSRSHAPRFNPALILVVCNDLLCSENTSCMILMTTSLLQAEWISSVRFRVIKDRRQTMQVVTLTIIKTYSIFGTNSHDIDFIGRLFVGDTLVTLCRPCGQMAEKRNRSLLSARWLHVLC